MVGLSAWIDLQNQNTGIVLRTPLRLVCFGSSVITAGIFCPACCAVISIRYINHVLLSLMLSVFSSRQIRWLVGENAGKKINCPTLFGSKTNSTRNTTELKESERPIISNRIFEYANHLPSCRSAKCNSKPSNENSERKFRITNSNSHRRWNRIIEIFSNVINLPLLTWQAQSLRGALSYRILSAVILSYTSAQWLVFLGSFCICLFFSLHMRVWSRSSKVHAISSAYHLKTNYTFFTFPSRFNSVWTKPIHSSPPSTHLWFFLRRLSRCWTIHETNGTRFRLKWP